MYIKERKKKMLTERFQIKDISPNGYKAVLALENYICSSKINPIYREMIKIRLHK